MRAAVYLRISQDATGDGLAVDRQRTDCQRIANERGWTITEEYVDTISAYNRDKARPAYQRLTQDYDAGKFGALICWDLDRLTRQPRQLEDWIEAAELRGLLLTTANGEADLSTDGGRMYARIKAAVARAEMERKSERQKAAHRQRVAAGRPWSPARPFGFEPDLTTHRPAEAAAIREAYARVIAGSGLKAICRDFTDRGILSSKGRPFSYTTLRQVLRSPRYAGFLEDGIPGIWDPIVAEDVWRTAQARLNDNPRTGRLPARLLSRIARCGVCGGLVGCSTTNGNQTYVCHQPRADGTIRKCVARRCDPVDQLVTDVIVARLSRPDAVDLLAVSHGDTAHLATEAAVLRGRLKDIAAAGAGGQLTMAEWITARDIVAANLAQVEARMVAETSTAALASLVGAEDVQAVWDGMDLGRQRAVVDALLTVTILPVKPGPRFRPEGVQIKLR